MKYINKLLDTEIEEKLFKRLVFLAIIFILIVIVIVFLNLGMMHTYKVPDDIEIKTKGKVESANRFVSRLYAYNNEFEDLNELLSIIKK